MPQKRHQGGVSPILVDGALVECIPLTGVETETPESFPVGDQRKSNAGCVTARIGFRTPRSENRIDFGAFNPARFTGSQGDTGRTPPSFVFFTPGDFCILNVIGSVSGYRHRPDCLRHVLFAMANPGQAESTHFHENLANRLIELGFSDCVNERVVALAKSLKDSVQPVQLFPTCAHRFPELLPPPLFLHHVGRNAFLRQSLEGIYGSSIFRASFSG